VKEIVPTAKSLGVVYNPGEANSVSLVELVKKHAPHFGMEVVEAGSPKSSDVLAATRSLVGKVDVIYIPTDNTVVSAFEAVIKVATQTKIPVISASSQKAYLKQNFMLTQSRQKQWALHYLKNLSSLLKKL